jgi:hypothetical protein
MVKEKAVEEVVEETPVVEVEAEVEAAPEGEEKHEAKKAASASLKDALKQVETFGQALSDALQARGNVVMVRVNDEALTHLDMLVDAEVTKSRSESAAFLIAEGIKANQVLFEKIGSITQQIAELREQLRKEVKLEPEA